MPPHPARSTRRRALTAAALLAASALSAAPAGAASPAEAASPGTLILAGGAVEADNTEVYGEFVRRAGGAGKARIGVITAASARPADDPDADDPEKCSNSVCNGRYYSDLFTSRHGAADARWIPIDLDHVSNNSDPEVLEQIDSMTGFFIGGGDQSRLVETFMEDGDGDSPALAALRAKLRGGAAVMGTSAGATIANGPDMVTGGESWQALRYGPRTTPDDDHPDDLTYRPGGGFAFLDSALVDTHVGARGRQARMARLAVATGHDRVYGVDENTALVVTDPGGEGESATVVGARGVSVLDLRRAAPGERGGYWSVDRVSWSYLTAGDTYTPATWSVKSGKPSHRPASGTVGAPLEDVFSSPDASDPHPEQLINAARELSDAGESTRHSGASWETDPVYEAHLTKGDGFTAWKEGESVTFTGLELDLRVR